MTRRRCAAITMMGTMAYMSAARIHMDAAGTIDAGMHEMEGIGAYLPFWKNLSAGERSAVEVSARERHYVRGEVLHAGDGCSGLLLVRKGQLRVYVISEEGKEVTLYRLLERDMCLFSASCILSDIQFDVMVEAKQDAVVWHIPAEVYQGLMETSLPVSHYTNRLMASRLSDVMWLMDQVLNKKLDSRLAALLLEERKLCGSDEVAVTHEQLGNHLGSVREVVTRMLKTFQEDGLVILARGKVRLVDIPRLSGMAKSSLH